MSAAWELRSGLAKLASTSASAASSMSTVVVRSMASAAWHTRLSTALSPRMSRSATRQMSSRAAPIASALDGLSCTMPSELSGMPLAGGNSVVCD